VQNNLILANDLSVSKSSSAGATTSLEGVISGAGALIKKGGGTVTILGSSNTYSGGTKVNDGQLTVNTINGSLGTGDITLGNGNTTGTIRWGDSFLGSSETSSKTITLPGTGGGGAFYIKGTNALTLTGAIDTGSDTTPRTLALGGNGIPATGYSMTLSGVISGNAKIRINGSGARSTLLGNENNSFTGGVTLDGNTSGVSYKTYVSKIGSAGANSPLGTYGTINFGTNNAGSAFNFLIWTSSVDETTDKVINLAGTTSGGLMANKGTAKLKFTSNLTATGLGSKTLYIDEDSVNATTEIAGSIPDSDGPNGLTTSINKNGLGTLTLSGANTFTGNTTIKGGTLEVKNSSALNAGNVIFAHPGTDSLSITFVNSGVLKLACGGVNASLNNLVVGSGSYAVNAKIDLGTVAGNVITFADATGWTNNSILTVANSGTGKLYISSFTNITTSQIVSAEHPTYTATFDSNGLLTFVNPNPSGFSSWIDGFSVADKAATGDSDKDGINNLLEYVLNGDPSVASNSILPSSAVTQSAFEFTFTRRSDSKNDTTLTFQYGSTLSGWTDVTVPSLSGTVNSATVTVTANGNSADTVKVSVPKSLAVGGKLFGRLKVVQ
jgi:autotransporter-associated beta strand protein